MGVITGAYKGGQMTKKPTKELKEKLKELKAGHPFYCTMCNKRLDYFEAQSRATWKKRQGEILND